MMPIARFQLPDGRIARFEVPDGTTPEQAQAMMEAHFSTKQEPTPKDMLGRTTKPASENIPDWARRNPRLYGAAQVARDVGGPVVEGLAAVGGAVLGTPAGPAGNVGGGALGYGIGKQLNRLADVALGEAQGTGGLPQAVADVTEGAAWQAGGNVVGQQVLPALGRGVAKVGGAIMDISPQQKAAKIAREAIGPDMDAIKRLLASGSGTPGEVAELTASVNNPMWHALIERGLGRDPAFTRAVAEAAQAKDTATLMRLAGGTTQTGSIAAQQAAKAGMRETLVPELKTELQAANTAAQQLPRLQGEAQRMADAAASKVQDVRRFQAAGDRAFAMEQQNPYMGLLQSKANDVVDQSARASLAFGEAARMAQMQADSLAAHKLKPLRADAIEAAIKRKLSDPSIGPNRDAEGVLTLILEDIRKWIRPDGTIPAEALDTIRKYGVNSAIQRMYPSMDAKQVKAMAAGQAGQLRPLIVDAIEEAGGTGYGAWLDKWAKGEQAINQQKMAAKLLELYEARPQSAAKLIEGDAPQRVEKLFGAGAFDIGKEMPRGAMNELEALARGVRSRETASEQAKEGADALSALLKQNLIRYRLPFLANVKATATNQVLSRLEDALGERTMRKLAEGLKTGQSAQQLIGALPAIERYRVLQALRNINIVPAGVASGTAVTRNAIEQMGTP